MKMNVVFIYKHPETTSQAKLDNSEIQKWWTINDSTICRLVNDCSLPIYQESNHLWVGHVTSHQKDVVEYLFLSNQKLKTSQDPDSYNNHLWSGGRPTGQRPKTNLADFLKGADFFKS